MKLSRRAKPRPPEMPHLFLATPMAGGMCHGLHLQSVMALALALQKMGAGFTYAARLGDSLVPKARDSLVRQFLSSPASHLLFLDADVAFQPVPVLRMISAGCDVIGAVYPRKLIDWRAVGEAARAGAGDLPAHASPPVVAHLQAQGEIEIDPAQPFEVRGLGAGCLLVRRQVFDRLAESVPAYVVDEVAADGTVRQVLHRGFFQTAIDEEGRFVSEDYAFCDRWRAVGGQVFAAPWVACEHIGGHVFRGGLGRP